MAEPDKTETSRKRILFLKRSGYQERTARIIEDLGTIYEVSIGKDLDETTLHTLKDERDSGRAINAMITPVHANVDFSQREQGESFYRYTLRNYSRSLRLLREINFAFPDMPVIAYTHASSEMDSLFQEEGRVRSVVHVSAPSTGQLDSMILRKFLEIHLS